MDFSVIKDMYINSYAREAWLNNVKVWSKGVDVDAIRNSMILWYDIARQGATNESMAENPVLKDLSGNGHDATCYNFAWSGMSGIGGIYWNINNFGDTDNGNYRANRTVNGNIITCTFNATLNNSGLYYWILYYSRIQGIKSTKVKITCNNDTVVGYRYWNGTINNIIIDDYNNIVTLPEGIPNAEDGGNWDGFYVNNVTEGTVITIELIPEYPNALVSDGVDDYARFITFDLLSENKLYHIAKYVKIKDTGKWQYLLDYYNKTNSVRYYIGNSSNNRNHYGEAIGQYDSDIFYGEAGYLYTDRSSHKLTLFSNEHVTEGANCALYSLLLFNRTLTTAEIEWVKKNLIEGNDDDVDWYGVEFYTTSPYPDCIRIGNPELHKTLPVHSQMKGCLLADEGTMNKYLNESDWTSETLDGSQGQVMVEMPKESYWKFETDGNIRRVKFSTKPLPGFKKTPQGYVSAYEASVQRSVSKLASVVNTDADYRGGNNHAGWDGTCRSLLGMPASVISRTDFRNYARNRKADSTEWNCMTYDMQKLLYWLFVVEYCTLNSQKTFNADKDANGCAQGGLGNGVTNLNGTKWNNFNGHLPLIPCGYTNSLGNGTGQIPYTMPFEYETSRAANYAGEYSAETSYTDGQFVSQGQELYECIADAAAGTALADTTYFKKVTRTVTYVPRYRGVENPFGHIWQWTDGINVRISPTTENGGDNLSKVFVCSDPAQFKDNGYEGYTYVGNEARTAQYVKEVIFGEGGEIMPKVVGDGASSTKYFCDYYYTNIHTTETLRGVLFGGCANDGAAAGFGYASSARAPSNTYAHFGSRLCFVWN